MGEVLNFEQERIGIMCVNIMKQMWKANLSFEHQDEVAVYVLATLHAQAYFDSEHSDQFHTHQLFGDIEEYAARVGQDVANCITRSYEMVKKAHFRMAAEEMENNV